MNSMEELNHDSGSKERRSTSIEDTNTSSPQRSLIAQDRISTLPEAILLHILSFLPTKDAIKTSVLSKTWSKIWTFLPCLSFKDYLSEPVDFASVIDDTLKLHRAPKISIFFIEFRYNSILQHRVDHWVHFATSAKVQQLRIYFLDDSGHETYVLPQHLYVNEFITALDLCLCDILPDGPVNWSSLKRLSIGCTLLTNDAIKKVLLGSPRLEFLELHNLFEFWVGDWFEPVHRLDVESESLRKLVIRGASARWFFSKEWDTTLVFEVVAPNIQALEILGNFEGMKCRLKNVASLAKAKIDFDMFMSGEDDDYEDEIVMVKNLFEVLHHVKELTVGRWCLWVLSIISVKHLPSPLPKCKCLTVKTDMEKWDLLGIISLLQSSPYLETLVIDMLPLSEDSGLMFSSKSFFNSYNYDGESYWKSKEMECLQLHLKTVDIHGFGELFFSNELFILLTQFLLKNSRVLEKMVIRNSRLKRIRTCDVLREFSNVAQNLLSFPRSSPHAVVLFQS